MSTATKDELIAEAEERGIEVPAGATKAEIEALLADNPPAEGEPTGGEEGAGVTPGEVQRTGAAGAGPSGLRGTGSGIVVPNDVNVRSDSDAIVGRFARVKSGEHEGRYGVVMYVGGEPDDDGFPTEAVLTTRDEMAEDLTVGYGDLEPAEAGHR